MKDKKNLLCLFFSFSEFFFLIFREEEKKPVVFLHSVKEKNFSQCLQETLEISGCSLKSIDSVYFTFGPGSQTKIRAVLVFVSTLQVLNKTIKLYCISSLL